MNCTARRKKQPALFEPRAGTCYSGGMDRAALAALAGISDDAFDAAPFGGIVVDATGMIERYNAGESSISNLSAERVIGKNFFHHVAPCTGVRAFEGRFLDFIASVDTISEGFTYYFPFSHGAFDVFVSFVKLTASDSVLIVVERTSGPHLPDAASTFSPLITR
jgi:photoactive yellow protein